AFRLLMCPPRLKPVTGAVFTTGAAGGASGGALLAEPEPGLTAPPSTTGRSVYCCGVRTTKSVATQPRAPSAVITRTQLAVGCLPSTVIASLKRSVRITAPLGSVRMFTPLAVVVAIPPAGAVTGALAGACAGTAACGSAGALAGAGPPPGA